MKTAMQLMLEDLELRYKVLSNAEMLQACGAIEGTIEYAKSLIIKEKEQIIDAHLDGMDKLATALNEFVAIKNTMLQIERIKNGIEKHDNGEEYYNQKYNN